MKKASISLISQNTPVSAGLSRAGFALTAALLVLPALPAGAGNFTPPESCKLEMTIQNRSCTVAQYYRCSSDNPGDQRVMYFDPNGATFESRIDKETRWLESTDLRSGVTDMLSSEAKDPASFATLLETGFDDFDFWTESSTGERLHHVGHDKLTGKKVTIGSVPLEETEFDLKTYSETGDLLIHRSGNQFISRAQGRFYGGVESSEDWTGRSQNTNDSPVHFAFPGQPGFGETQPAYDCDLQMVRAYSTPTARIGAPS
ncbi:hypothetical protein [Paracoccus aminophilus]|uniref:Uncharacterized protein n=1 Tax=Paracoccus aminophilus JCM 7686 TaxID=1367847 RepID=S5Y2V0_PARAH|nr:hypothetical protein [Paracoccus aminophilus]AGT10055.1 hypothetical protein JCM7686_3019 [Paracoccus aminophilus JCM 7686]